MEDDIKFIIVNRLQCKIEIVQMNGDVYSQNFDKYNVDELDVIENFISLMQKRNG